MIVRCAHGHVCLVNAGHTLHPLLLDPCEGFDERERVMLNHDWTKATASNPIGNCLEARWRKASASNGNGGGNCLESRWQAADASATNGTCVEARTDQGSVQIRDSKDPDGPVLTFTPAEWVAFLDGARKGEFDLPDGVTA